MFGAGRAAKKNLSDVEYYGHHDKAYVGRLLNMSRAQLEAEHAKTNDDTIKAIIAHIITERR